MSPTRLLFSVLTPRDGISGNGNSVANNTESGSNWWWTSPTAYAVKWGIIAGIFVLFLAFLLIGYLHAQKRMKKGLPPLRYHRWLVTRSQRARFDLPQNNFSFYRPQDGYAMHGYAPPPPAYNPDGDNVPAYSPPEGASKAKADQDYAEIPPAGPPPSHSEDGPSYKESAVMITPPGVSSGSYPR